MAINERFEVPSVPLFSSLRIPAVCAVRNEPASSDRLPELYLRTHAHRFYSLYFVESGAGTLRVGDTVTDLARGALMLVAPRQAHDIAQLLQCDFWVVAFEHHALDSCVLRPSAQAASVPLHFVLHACAFSRESRVVESVQRERWLGHFAWLRNSLEDPDVFDGQIERPSILTLNAIGIDVIRLFLHEGAAPLSLWQSPVIELMQRYIETHYRFPISLKNVAAALDLSPAYLTDLVHRQSGGTVLAWINARRFIDARRLLAQTVSPVAEIAITCGFSEPSNFVRRFERAHAGLSPSAWRAAAQEQSRPQGGSGDHVSFASDWRRIRPAP